jgi:hypothetical protein
VAALTDVIKRPPIGSALTWVVLWATKLRRAAPCLSCDLVHAMPRRHMKISADNTRTHEVGYDHVRPMVQGGLEGSKRSLQPDVEPRLCSVQDNRSQVTSRRWWWPTRHGELGTLAPWAQETQRQIE